MASKYSMTRAALLILIQELEDWRNDSDAVIKLYTCSICKAEVGEACTRRGGGYHASRQDKMIWTSNSASVNAWRGDLSDDLSTNNLRYVVRSVKKSRLYKRLAILEKLAT